MDKLVKIYVKCLVCGCEKQKNPGVRFFGLPGDKERRDIWLIYLNRTHLIHKKISNHKRVCEKHFASNMFGKSGYRLKDYAMPIKEFEIPTEIFQISDDSQSISSQNPEVTEIGITRNVGFMNQQIPETSKEALVSQLHETSNDELFGRRNGYNEPFPTAHQFIASRFMYIIEDEINKLKKECEELRKENAELRKERNIKRTGGLFLEELPHIGVNQIRNLQHDHQGWSHHETEHPDKRRKLTSSGDFVLLNCKNSSHKSNEGGEIDIKDQIDIKEEPLDETDLDIKPDIKDLQYFVTNASNAPSLFGIKPDPDGNGS